MESHLKNYKGLIARENYPNLYEIKTVFVLHNFPSGRCEIAPSKDLRKRQNEMSAETTLKHHKISLLASRDDGFMAASIDDVFCVVLNPFFPFILIAPSVFQINVMNKI